MNLDGSRSAVGVILFVELFKILYWLNFLLCILATMFKIIKEMLPPDVRVARDAQDLLVECCVGKTSECYTVYTTRVSSIIWYNLYVQLCENHCLNNMVLHMYLVNYYSLAWIVVLYEISFWSTELSGCSSEDNEVSVLKIHCAVLTVVTYKVICLICLGAFKLAGHLVKDSR